MKYYSAIRRLNIAIFNKMNESWEDYAKEVSQKRTKTGFTHVEYETKSSKYKKQTKQLTVTDDKMIVCRREGS